MCGIYGVRHPVFRDPKSTNQVKPEKRQVHHVVFGERLVFEMCVNQAQTLETAFSDAVFMDLIGEQNLLVSANNYILRNSLSINQYTDLTACFS